MKKVLSQISLILLVMMIGLASVFITNTYASGESAAQIKSPSSVKEGEEFTVSLIFPAGYDIAAAQANVTVTYSDGTKQTDKIVYTVDKALNLTVDTPAKFKAKVAGNATISLTGIYMYKEDGTPVEEAKTKSKSLTVTGTPKPNTNTTGGGTSTGSGNTAGENKPSTGNTTGGGTKPSTGNTTSGGTNTGSGNTTGNKPVTKEPKFTDVNETVYTTKKCNIRKSYSTDSDKIATLEKNTKLTRKGIGDNGWSKVEYNGKTAYVFSEYLTKEESKDEEVVFKDTHENLYAKQSCNLRASWSTDSEKVGYLEKGQPVERTGYSDNGWSRILYEGKTVYVASRLLVVEKPEDEDGNTVANNVVNNVIDNTVENAIEDPTQMSEEDRLKELQDEIGVLPEVGTNAANIAYMVVTLIAIAGVVAGIIYIKKIK